MENILTKMDYNLETERLNLSLIESDDADQLFKNMSNPLISIDMSWKPHDSIIETKKFIDAVENSFINGKAVTWCLRLKNTEIIIGIFSVISIVRKHRELTYNKGELAYWIDPVYQGKGYMSEAGRAIVRFAFLNLNLNKLIVSHHLNNENSKRLIIKLKFEHSHVEQQSFKKNGQWIDVSHYELLKSKFQL